MSNKKMLFVVNPHAGKGSVSRHLADIVNNYCAAGYEITIQTTQCGGDATRIVRQYAGGKDTIVCCGGDGTLNETLAGVIDGGFDVDVGYIPCGTTNDMARSLGLPVQIMRASDRAINGEPLPYDMGMIDGKRYFTYITAFGIFTRSSYATPQKMKKTFGHFAYVLDGAKELANIKEYKTRVTIDDQVIEDEFIYGAASNSISFAGMFKFPEKCTDLNDGLFEVLLIRKPRSPVALGELYMSLQKRRFTDKHITLIQAEKVIFETEEELTWTIDGEKGEPAKRVELENLHSCVRIIR